jgi:arabinofuranosyltransferase
MRSATTPISPIPVPDLFADQPRWQPADTIVLAFLLVLSSAWIALKIHWSWTPMEDAAMLLRYSQHFAAGHGIRWSLNQAPVDGATDFLFMIFTGALARGLHISVITASRWVNIIAQTLSVVLVYTGSRRLGGSNLGGGRLLSTAAALYLIAGPFIGLTNACFGAPLFAFFLLACWDAGLRYALKAPKWTTAFAMAIFGLFAGLTRPEGVLVAALILLASLYLTRNYDLAPHRARLSIIVPALVALVLVFGILGGFYFGWHWRYFGYPLPNPFYIKGNGHLYPSSITHAAMNLVTLLLPVLPLLPLGWLSDSTRRVTNALCIILIPFILMWILLSNANNHFFRFQYAVVPLVLMTAPTLARGFPNLHPFAGSRLQRTATWIAATLTVFAGMLYVNRITNYDYTAWGMRTFAQRLQPLASKGYTMAVTEAGALPLYSEWNTIDGIGLNDAYIAHHHQQIDADYLDRTHPELIMVHIDRSVPEEYLPGGLSSAPPHPGSAYNAEFMNFYASTHGYTLAAAWGADQCNLHLYWLRPPSATQAFPDYATVLSDIRDHPYIFLDDAFLSHDYRNDMASIQPCAAPEGPPQ